MGRLARSGLKKKLLDYEQLTIEHLIPQSNSMLAPHRIANVGNLILVDADLNERLAAKAFEEKKPLLQKAADVWKDDVIDATVSWSNEKITERARFLAKYGREKVWRI